MRICSVIWMTVFSLSVCTFAQQPAITSFQPDGTITWTNISTNCVAVVQELSPATTGQWAAAHSEQATALVGSAQMEMANSPAWFRVANTNESGAPSGMVLIPGGSNSGTNPLVLDEYHEDCRYPATYSLAVGSFYMDRNEVTNDEMVRVMQWAYDHNPPLITVTASTVQNALGDPQELLDLNDGDCRITWDGSSFGMNAAKGSGYPCVEVSWYGSVAYCNYRSEIEGLTPCYDLSDWSCDFGANGYRLPTSEEWEYAARGGSVSKRFPWGGDTISHAQANYKSTLISYDLSCCGYHPTYGTGVQPYTSPVGAFAANAYGLYDMAGNVWEWCTDWHPCFVGLYRVRRGGSWIDDTWYCRVGQLANNSPDSSAGVLGFRAVLPADQ